MMYDELFEILPLNPEAQFEAGRSRSRPIVLPTLTIRDQPFVVLDRFDFKVSAVPAMHDPIIERIARLVLGSRVSGEPIDSIRLVGHTDASGDEPFTLKFGKERAQSVEAKLRAAIAAIAARESVPARTLSIVAQSLGETRPVASNASAAGRALNRRVQVFLPTTCNSFFAQYDLRFLPGDTVFGIPAHPNLSTGQKDQRSKDVNAMVLELRARRDLRASEALAGRIPAPKALPRGALRSSALRLSDAQLALYREYFPDGRGGIAFDAFQSCFERFANGELRSPMADEQAKGVGEPNGGAFFLFAEFAFLCIASHIEAPLWTNALRSLVKAQEIFMHVYRPSPVTPPAVGAALPACPRDPGGRPRARRTLARFRNRNFRTTGASPTVGAGQSGPARKRDLANKYASADLAVLQRAAQANLLRAQCMP